MNRGALGTRLLNIELQKILNPSSSIKVDRSGLTFSLKDKVIVTTNDYEKEVFNGDIGFIKKIDPDEEEVLLDFDGREVSFHFSELDILSLAYAITIHKSQGSEYPAVVIPVTMQHAIMLKRNLLYTGVTRGKKLVCLVGERRALELAVRTESQNVRWNKLAERLRSEDASRIIAPFQELS
jgi:exodeoxyribonuclease V alpha subunit